MSSGYTPDETVQIDRNYAVVAEAITSLHAALGDELHRAYLAVQQEVRESAFAKVLVVGELLRGVNKDERRPISSQSLVMSPALMNALSIAYRVGVTVAPFVLRNQEGFLRKRFGAKPPRLSQAAKEAILRCKMIHAGSKNRSRDVALSALPPGNRQPVAQTRPPRG